MLTKQESYRYQRQIILPQVGELGQEKLKNARVFCVGAGGLGAPVLMYLAAAGVGTIGFIDDDVVEESNLHRQILFSDADLRQSKAMVAKEKISVINPSITINAYQDRLSDNNALTILANYDVVIDGTDNFYSKYLINAAAIKLGIPMIYASILGFEGRIAIFSDKMACYACLYPESAKTVIPNCAEAGVLGPLAGIIGSMQALETIKWLLSDKRDSTEFSSVLIMNALTLNTSQFLVEKKKDCAICGIEKSAIVLPKQIIGQCVMHSEKINQENIIYIDVREADEFEYDHIPNAIHLPLSKLQENTKTALFDLSRDHHYILYCQKGIRSQVALMLFEQAGFKNTLHIQGGFDAWKKQSLIKK